MANRNIISVSGGKDSLATWLVALERETENMQVVFADTGHEHAQTYEYVDYLESQLGPITRVKADFSVDIERKRGVVQTKWRAEGVSEEIIERALSVLHPSGNPFLDLCLWKGRFPSTRRRFCSEQLKHLPIDSQVIQPALADCDYDEVWSWQGVRADESAARAQLPETEEHPKHDGLITYRPILTWTAEDVFAIAKRHGIKSNPLYTQGMGRVGCMPCIHCGKDEMRELAKRFPEELERVAEWERLVGMAAKRQASTFMDARVVQRHLGLPKITADNVHTISHETHGIKQYVGWAKTARGGRQWDLIQTLEDEDVPLCSSIYGLCE
jgi:3'-phosphoadenosine 5'-phosphosulfate sulfotransferase (PAPS reductase)/FAD synthetase